MTKTCSRCKKDKNVEDFYRRVSSKDGLTAACGECLSLYNLSKYHETGLSEKQKKANAIVSKVWVDNNRQRKNLINSNWVKNNKPKHLANVVRRQLAKLQRTPKWLTKLQLSHIELFYSAAAELTKELGVAMEVDHRVPLRGKMVSGLHVPWNLQVIPRKENRSKGNKF